ncbi:MAG TPA: rhodanese-like domain-containing protein [Acidimicrobiales bacterium]|nr:rhodanese-like domain-containing protein [Acidimicrobiales bacterium]
MSQQNEVEEVAPGEASSMLERGAFLLDVRESDEWNAGHAPGAHHIPLGDLESRHLEIPRDRTILCICRAGSRSGYAAAALGVLGFATLNVRGGMQEWDAVSLPVVADDGPGQVI